MDHAVAPDRLPRLSPRRRLCAVAPRRANLLGLHRARSKGSQAWLTSAKHMLKEFVEFLKQYKEIVLAIGVIGGGILFVRDYFATRTEVSKIECRQQLQLNKLRADFNTDKIGQEILDLQDLRPDEQGSGKTNSSLELEIKNKERELAAQQAKSGELEAALIENSCD